jgi:hypothetical protein
LKDKPFYVEPKIILERQVIDGFIPSGTEGYAVLLPYKIDYPDGVTLTVFWDGAEYNCISVNGFLGNAVAITGQFDDVPFVIWREADGGTSAIIALISITGDTNTSHEIGIVGETIHKLDAKYLPNSVWTEKNTRVILENQTVKGVFHLTTDTFFAEGETVTVVWDGVTYERVASNSKNPWVGETAYLFDIGISGEPFAIDCRPTDNEIVVVSCNDGRLETENTHTVSVYVYEEVVKTNCDLFVKSKWTRGSDDWEIDNQLLQGDFATAKAKIQKGLPVKAFVIIEQEPQEGDTSLKSAEVCSVYLFIGDNEEYLNLYGYYELYIYPDNTIEH